MQKNIMWAMTVTSVLGFVQAASAASATSTEVNDYRSQFNAQKAAIEAQSSGQWINGKRSATEETLKEGAYSDHVAPAGRPFSGTVSGFNSPSHNAMKRLDAREDSDGAE